MWSKRKEEGILFPFVYVLVFFEAAPPLHPPSPLPSLLPPLLRQLIKMSTHTQREEEEAKKRRKEEEEEEKGSQFARLVFLLFFRHTMAKRI